MNRQYLLKKFLSLPLLFCLFAGTAMGQRNFKFKRHGDFGGEEHRSILSVNLLLGGLGFGYAVGGEYERIIGADGKFSIHLPITYSSSNDHFLSVADDGDRQHNYKTFYVAPGFRFHPAGAFHRADFSLGLQLAAGPVSVTENYINQSRTITTNHSTVFVAPLGDLNLNINSADGFVFGLYMAGGPVLQGDFGTATNGRLNKSLALVQMGIKLGGCF